MESSLTPTEEKPLAVYDPRELTSPEIVDKLKAYMDAKPKQIMFNGKRYPEFDDYQFAGSFFGWKGNSNKAVYQAYGEVNGFSATGFVVDKNGMQIGTAEAFCGTDEPNWAKKPVFQRMSMAQTRATAKAFSNILRPLFTAAGYASTPAEEMTGDEREGPKPLMRPQPKKEVQESEVITFPAKEEQPAAATAKGRLSEKQRKLLFVKTRDAGITEEAFRAYLKKEHGTEHTTELSWKSMDKVLQWIESNKQYS